MYISFIYRVKYVHFSYVQSKICAVFFIYRVKYVHFLIYSLKNVWLDELNMFFYNGFTEGLRMYFKFKNLSKDALTLQFFSHCGI
jgi:hypothetical protein